MERHVLPDQAVTLIETFTRDISRIEGVTVKIIININERFVGLEKSDDLERIVDILEAMYDDELTGIRIKSDCRKREYNTLRLIYYKIAREHHFTYRSIGIVANRDHTTAIAGENSAKDMIDTDPKFKALYLRAKQLVNDNLKHERAFQPHIAA
jgi:chromosomal replication initiation ATPase DnaA